MTRELTPAQRGLGDMDVEEFRRRAHEVADRVADYLARLESYPVLPPIEPGEVYRALPASPPATAEPFESALEDYARLIEPNITHWQHPGFMAYFPSVASGPGILGEWLASGLNSNVMLWRNAPASTELEQLVVSWLRQMLGLPERFDGMFTDTASVSSLLSLVAARHAAPELRSRDEGLAGKPPLRLYASEEAHSSIEKAAIVVGIGRSGLHRIAVDASYRMDPQALAAAIAEDRRAGLQPFCVVATLGTTSSTSVDPVAEIATICEREKLWLHVDAAYAGAAAILPEMRPHFVGWERAQSIVFNPHKWLFTPFDASLLLFPDADTFRDAFSLVPEYLRTSASPTVRNFNELGVQLGRRFRALKLWLEIRYFGVEGIAARLREHCRMAAELARRIDELPDWELLAPAPFSTVCFRHHPPGIEDEAELDRINEALLAALNRKGPVFLSHTRLAGRLTLRVALGNPRQTARHVEQCFRLLQEAARQTP